MAGRQKHNMAPSAGSWFLNVFSSACAYTPALCCTEFVLKEKKPKFGKINTFKLKNRLGSTENILFKYLENLYFGRNSFQHNGDTHSEVAHTHHLESSCSKIPFFLSTQFF